MFEKIMANATHLTNQTTPQKMLTTTRRGFLITASAVAGGILIGFRNPAAQAADDGAANPLAGYIHIAPDSKVTILSSQFDMGQGSYYGIATLVVEELEADWAQIDVVGASGNVKLYGNIAFGGAFQGTGGSTSMASSFERYRMAGATARKMLIAAAALKWGVAAKDITVSQGIVSHGSDKSASFGDLAAAAAELPIPQNVKMKSPSDWQQIGNVDLRRYDSGNKAKGRQNYTIDVKLDGMLTAVISHSPKFGGTVKSFDASAALKVRGVRHVVEIPRGVAVVGDHMWAAIKGREALQIEWDDSKAEQRGSAEIIAQYHALSVEKPQAVARKTGDVDNAFSQAATTIEASYSFPYLAHATMEPLNAVARKNDDGTLEIWGGHQMPDIYAGVAASIAGLKPANIKLHVMKTGGGFGRRGTPDGDVVAEAVMVAKAIDFKAPVKVQWTREDDMHGGRYRPAYVHHLKAGLDKDGKLIGWNNHIVGQSIMANTFMAGTIKDGIDGTSVEGASNIPYAIDNILVGLTTTESKIPVLWWRSVGSTHTAYAVETFLDEVASTAGKDPYQYRMELLRHQPRHAAVLKLAALKAEWGKPLPAGRFHGLAVHESFNSVAAHVAEISVKGKTVTVHKVTVAIDCGIAINPDTVKAQMEGGTGFGLGAIMAEELTLAKGVVEQDNYDSYTPLRLDVMPEIVVHIVPSDNAPTGVGELGVPSIGPAIANAIAAATGKRIRDLPIIKSL